MSATAVFEERVQAVSRARLPLARQHRITLGQLLTRAHEGVHAHGTADCPVCGGALRRAGTHSECTGCRSRLG